MLQPWRVHVRQVRKHQDRLGPARRLDGLLHGLHRGRHLAPVDGRLDGIDRIAVLPKAVAQIGRAEPGMLPKLAQDAMAKRGAARLAQARARLRCRQSATCRRLPVTPKVTMQRSPSLQPSSREAAVQEARQRMTAGQRQLRRGFHRVGQAHHGQRHLGLRQLPDQVQAGAPVGHEGGVKRFTLGQRRDAQLDLGDRADPALRCRGSARAGRAPPTKRAHPVWSSCRRGVSMRPPANICSMRP